MNVRAGDFDEGDARRLTFSIRLLRRDIGNVHGLLRPRARDQGSFSGRVGAVRVAGARRTLDGIRAGPPRGTARRRIDTEYRSWPRRARRVRKNGLEHRLELARRARDDAQHLGGRGLLLQRLGELPFQLGAGRAAAANARSRLRSGRTKLATTRSAFRALARQGHPGGTSIDPGSLATDIKNITRQGR